MANISVSEGKIKYWIIYEFIVYTFLRLWTSIIPLAVLFCFGLVLFLTSSTIILSLIPTYLPGRDQPTTLSSISDPQSIILSSNNAVPSGSVLDTANQNSIQNQVRILFVIVFNLIIH